MSLVKRLQLWKENNLITEEIEKNILSFEKSQKRSNVFSIILLIIGIVFVFCGVIALIGFNWHKIHSFIKLFVSISSLAVCNFFIYKAKQENKPLLLNSLILVCAGLIAGNIALVAQIYHLDSNWGNGVLLWCLLALPLMFFSDKVWVMWVWIPTFVVYIFKVSDNLYYRFLYYDYNNHNLIYYIIFVCLAILLFVLPRLVPRLKNYSFIFNFYSLISIFSALIVFEIYNIGFSRFSPYSKSNLGFIHTVVISTGMLFYFYKSNKFKLFNLIFLIISLRVVIFIFEKFGSALSIGIMFIFIGFIMFGMFMLWRSISNKAKRVEK